MGRKIDLRTLVEKLHGRRMQPYVTEQEREVLRSEFEQDTGVICDMPSWADSSFPDEYVLWLEKKVLSK